MEPEKVLKFLTENIGDWSRVTLLTLLRPISRFELVTVAGDSTSAAISGVQTERQLWLHPKLLIFSVISIVLGLAMNALIPGRKPAPELLASILIIFLLWIVSGSLLYVGCRFLGGKGEYLETISVTLQVSATVYVIASFLALVLSALTSIPVVRSKINVERFLGNDLRPVAIFFAIGGILTAIYIPLALKSVHRFGWFRTALISVMSLTGILFSIAIYLSYGVLVLKQ